MIEPMTLARPYARAVFAVARAQENLDAWHEVLQSLAAISVEPRVSAMLQDPARTAERRAEVVAGLVDGNAPAGLSNFLSVMASNHRLSLLPEVALQFAELKAQQEATVEVAVTSARDVTDDEAARLADAIARKLSRTVTLTTQTDPALLGGAVIRAGDLVIDGSVRGRLNKLSGALTP